MNTIKNLTESFKIKYEAFLIGCDAIEDSGLWNKDALGEMEAFYLNDMCSIIIRLIAADGHITKNEVEYFNQNFGFEFSVDELRETYKLCSDDIGRSFDESFENGISYMRNINEKLADAYKELLALICKIIIESDGVVDPAETAEIKKLLSMCEA